MSVCWCNSTIDNWWSCCEDPWAAVRLTASGTASVRLTGCLGDAGTDRRWRGRQMTENERGTVGVQHHLTRERERVCVCVMKSQLLVCLSVRFFLSSWLLRCSGTASPHLFEFEAITHTHTKKQIKSSNNNNKKEPSVVFFILHCCHGNNWALRCSKLSAKKDTSAGRWTKTEIEMKAGHANTKCLNVLLMLQSVNYSLIHHTTLIITPFFDKSDNTLWNAPKLSISNQWMPCRHEAMNPSSPSKDFKWLLFKVAKLKYVHFCFRCVNRPYNTQ